MKKGILIFAVFLLSHNLTFCQDAKFITLTVKGSVVIYRGSKPIPAKVGEKIYDKDRIKVNRKSYLNLVYKDGRTIELKSAGTYETGKLVKQVSAKKKSTTTKFTNFVLSEFAKSIDDLDNMKVTGAVERIVKFPIDYGTPSKINVVDQVLTFCWFPTPVKSYIFKLADKTGKVLYSTQTKDTSLTLNFQKLKLERGNNFKWYVNESGKEKSLTDTCSFYWLSKAEESKIEDSLNILRKNFSSLDQAVKQVLLATFYSNRRLYVDMLQAYTKAMELSPDNSTYKKLYILALDRVGLKRQAVALSKNIK